MKLTNEEVQRIVVRADDFLDMLKDKAKETDELAKENLQLRIKISKAIEFLNNECLYDEDFGYCDDLYCGQIQKLVDILKGVDKE